MKGQCICRSLDSLKYGILFFTLEREETTHVQRWGPLPDLKHLKGVGGGTGRATPRYLLAIPARRCVNGQEAAIRGPEQALCKYWSGVREKRFATLRIPELERICHKILAIWRPENSAWLFLNALTGKEELACLRVTHLNGCSPVFSYEKSETCAIGRPGKNVTILWLDEGKRSQRGLEMDGPRFRVQNSEPGCIGSEARRINVGDGTAIGGPFDPPRAIALIIAGIGERRCPKEVTI